MKTGNTRYPSQQDRNVTFDKEHGRIRSVPSALLDLASMRALLAAMGVLCTLLHAVPVEASPHVVATTPENEAAVLRAVVFYNDARRAADGGELQRAVQLYEDAIASYALLATAYNNLAMLVYDLTSDRNRALALLEQGSAAAQQLGDNSTLAATRNNMGFVTRDQQVRSIELCMRAIEFYDQAIQAAPEFVGAMYNKASALLVIRQLDQAENLLRRVLELEPSHDNAHLDLGSIRFERGDVGGAVAHQDAIIAGHRAAQTTLAALHNKGHFLKSAGQLEEALHAHDHAIRLEPLDPIALADLVTAKRTLCLWDEREELLDRMLAALESTLVANGDSSSPLLPYDSTVIEVSGRMRKRLAVATSRALEQSATLELRPRRRVINAEGAARALRVGYSTCDFNDHPMGHLTLGLLDAHEPSRVDAYCYSYGVDDGSEWRRRAETRCANFHDGREQSDLALAQQMGLDEVDIVVDLMAHTTGTRVGIVALRPSPIVVNYLGYPGTMGASFTDFVLADRFVVPPEVARLSMSEQLVYLPHAYQVNQYDLEIPACSAGDDACVRKLRRTQGLPHDRVVFCNFNTIDKMEPASFTVWLNVLRRAPKSVLWLLEPAKKYNARIQATLRGEAQARGVDPARIFFAERTPKREHIARVTAADLFLDSFVYNAHSTAADALWANVPIVTLWGDAFASRVAASLIRNLVGLPELVPHSMKEYEDLAVELAQNPELLRRIRAELAHNVLVAPLFDTKRIARHIETAYELMSDVHHRVLPPDQFTSTRRRVQLLVAPSTADTLVSSDHAKQLLANAVERGISNQENGQCADAKHVYERVLRAQPDHSDALHLLGLALFQLGKLDQAVQQLTRVVELYNSTSLFRYNRAVVLAQVARRDEAEADLIVALQLDPHAAGAFLQLTDILQDADEYEKLVAAYAHFGETVLASPSFPETERERAYLQLSFALTEVERTQDAILLLQTAQLQHPTFFRLGFNLAAIHSSAGDHHTGDEVQIETARAESRFLFQSRGQYFAKRVRPLGRKVVAFYCHEYGQSWWDAWGPSSLQKGLGGSEEAVVFLSRELSRLGFWVEVYGDPPPQDTTNASEAGEPIDGVQWYPHHSFDPDDDSVDVFIAWRYHISLAIGARSRRKFFWIHDVPSLDTQHSRLLTDLVDGILCVSHFQASLFPRTLAPKLLVTSNALDPAHLVDSQLAAESRERNRRFVYGSSPSRGLFQVLHAWPRIRARVPGATLRVFYGFTPAFMSWGRRHMEDFNAWKATMDRMLQQHGVEYVGLVDHNTLAREYASAGFYLYPTAFSETSCVSLMKAMAHGAVPITSRFSESALAETTAGFDLGPTAGQSANATSHSDAWLDSWVDAVVAAVTNEAETENLRQRMVQFARRKYQWANVAAQWRELFRLE